MDGCKTFNEKTLTEKEDIYILLNMKDITDAPYEYTKRVCKDFEINNLGEYRDLYVQNDFWDIFELEGIRIF